MITTGNYHKRDFNFYTTSNNVNRMFSVIITDQITTFIKLIHLNVIFRSVSSCNQLGIKGKIITDHRDQRHKHAYQSLYSPVQSLCVNPSGGNTQPKVCSHALTRPSHTHTVPTLLTAAALLHRFTLFSTRSAGVLRSLGSRDKKRQQTGQPWELPNRFYMCMRKTGVTCLRRSRVQGFLHLLRLYWVKTKTSN